MSDNSELQAELEAKKAAGWQYTDGLSIDTVLALIAENDQLKKDRRTEHQSLRSDKARYSLYMMIAASLIDDHPYERTGSDWDYEHPLHDKIISLLDERDHLKAENAGLKTGYEAYEQVNAGLKAECEALREEVAIDNRLIADRDRLLNLFECPEHGQCIPYAMEQVAELRKHAERSARTDAFVEAVMEKREQS